ncbi:MAG: hypothetical protein QM796_04705 [Chthoniobacteraceae bacterium]
MQESAFPEAEIHCTEWSSSSSPRDFTHDFLQAATYVVKVNASALETVDSLSYWTFTDIFEEGGAGDTLFHGGFGMINLQGIVKPVFHAYRLLNTLGNEVVARSEATIVTRAKATGKLSALAWHYPVEVRESVPASFASPAKAEETLACGQPELLNVTWTGLKAGTQVLVETLDKAHGNALAAWESMGKPEAPTREQTRQLRVAARATRQQIFPIAADGTFTFTAGIEPWTVISIREI